MGECMTTERVYTKVKETLCEHAYHNGKRWVECSELYNCCDCGNKARFCECCRYCFSCNACGVCLNDVYG